MSEEWHLLNEETVDLVESLLRKWIAYSKTFDTLSLEDLTDNVAREIASRIQNRFEVQHKFTRTETYLLTQWGKFHPFCDGCFNMYGSCGTPCTTCKKAELFDKIWELVLWIPNQFTIYKRRRIET